MWKIDKTSKNLRTRKCKQNQKTLLWKPVLSEPKSLHENNTKTKSQLKYSWKNIIFEFHYFKISLKPAR